MPIPSKSSSTDANVSASGTLSPCQPEQGRGGSQYLHQSSNNLKDNAEIKPSPYMLEVWASETRNEEITWTEKMQQK
ncbi:hypothetical protein BX600DRAFT_519468 [Xylariales sp. PMI_506]|nr:hypothetical protein BX600DRAFT_519468 [Xylariales sp. PMI_506]